MTELRRDHLHDTWVIVSPGRGDRPRDVRLESVAAAAACPFCPGNEAETPPELLATGRPAGASADRPPWRVRVVPNRYPAVAGETGRHEVVVFSPDHDRELADLDRDEAAELLCALRRRYRGLEEGAAWASVLFFVNAGAGAGASLSHPHGQLLATPVVPSLLRTELAACTAWNREHGGCLLCAAMAEASREDRVVLEGEGALALAPRASRFAWETMVLPRRHAARFAEAGDEELATVAAALVGVCGALRAAAQAPAYNLVLHSAPPGVQDFHWHLELLPRLAPLAGFETGTGFHINPVPPEAAARQLRRALASSREEPA